MVTILLSLLGLAQAKGNTVSPYMNGVGLTMNTMVAPQQFPAVFPKYKPGDEKIATNMEKVQLDIGVGAKALMYVNRQYRAYASPYYQRSMLNDAGFSAFSLEGGVDKTALRERNVMAYYGVGLGKSWMKFDQSSQSKGVLTAQQLYGKAQVGGIYFNRTSAYEVSLYAKLGITGLESYERAGTTYEGNTLGNGLYSPVIGLEATYYIGDFRAIHKKKKKGKKKGKGKKNNR